MGAYPRCPGLTPVLPFPCIFGKAVDDITGFILAGGRSTRMGEDKTVLDWHGRPLLDHMLDVARSIAAGVRVVGSRAGLCDYGGVIEDIYPDRGPLAGIHAALSASTTELNLILAVDMPFIEPAFLEYLAAQARAAAAVVTAPRIAGRWQPLCAVYHRSFVESAERALHSGRNKIDVLFDKVPVRAVDDAELMRLAFPDAMFENLNTRQQYEQARTQRRRTP